MTNYLELLYLISFTGILAVAYSYLLSGQILSSSAGNERMQEIAEEIDRRNADIVIQAQNDSEGRWIYKHLNSYSVDRIRATFEISGSPQVILHY